MRTLIVRSSEAEAKVLVSLGLNTTWEGVRAEEKGGNEVVSEGARGAAGAQGCMTLRTPPTFKPLWTRPPHLHPHPPA